MNKRELKRPETVEVEAIGSFHLAWSWQSGVESAARRSPQGAVCGWRSREFAPCQKARSASPASYTLLGQSFGITQQAVVAGEVEGLRVFLLNCDIFLPTRLETRTKESNIYAIMLVFLNQT